MTRDEILAFLKDNPICFLASVDGDRPRVRGMMLYLSNAGEIYFHTAAGRDMTAQIKGNPNVEFCAPSKDGMATVRVAGVAEFIDDLAVKQEIVAARPMVGEIVKMIGWDGLVVFRVNQGVATVWTMATNMAPKTYVDL